MSYNQNALFESQAMSTIAEGMTSQRLMGGLQVTFLGKISEEEELSPRNDSRSGTIIMPLKDIISEEEASSKYATTGLDY